MARAEDHEYLNPFLPQLPSSGSLKEIYVQGKMSNGENLIENFGKQTLV
jgi:hypothetical protein